MFTLIIIFEHKANHINKCSHEIPFYNFIFQASLQSMIKQVKEQELYEDLSIILQLYKKRIFNLINKQQRDPYDEVLSSETDDQSQDLLKAFIHKYTNFNQFPLGHQKVIQRFLCRIKELTTQLSSKIPRQKLNVVRYLRETQQFVSKQFDEYNHTILINFIELVLRIKSMENAKAKIEAQSYNLNNESKTIPKQLPIGRSFQRWSAGNIKPHKRISEVEVFQKSATIFGVADIDMQHLRGRYFDLKHDKDGTTERDMHHRNRYIKQIISAYHAEYQRYKNKIPVFQRSKVHYTKNFFEDRQQKEEQSIIHNVSMENYHRVDTVQSIDFPSPSRTYLNNKRLHSNNSTRKPFSFNYKTLSSRNRQKRIVSDTFRSIMQQKFSYKKENVKIKNMQMNFTGFQTKIGVRDENEKKMQFFKKSQDQIKFRYKYYNYKQPQRAKSSIKYRTINPQFVFHTIDN